LGELDKRANFEKSAFLLWGWMGTFGAPQEIKAGLCGFGLFKQRKFYCFGLIALQAVGAILRAKLR
jgi:hypothetical protein